MPLFNPVNFSSPPPIGNVAPNTGAFTIASLTAALDYTVPPAATTSLSPNLLNRTWVRTQSCDLFPGIGGAVWNGGSGTGSASGGTPGDVFARLSTGIVALSSEICFYNQYGQFSRDGVTGNGKIDFSLAMAVEFRFSIDLALTTNASFWCVIGKGNGAGALDAPGFGFIITFKSTGIGSLKLQTYDSSLHTSAELSEVTATDDAPEQDVVLESDGAGNVYLYLNGVYKGTAATGPTAVSSSSRTIVQQITNGADLSNNRVYVTLTRVVVKKN